MSATQADRGCWWVIRPEELPSGSLWASFGIRVGTVRDFYRSVRVEADDMGSRWEVAKELADGSFAPAYTVFVPVASSHTRPACSCPGWLHGGKCRHTGALTALLAAVK